MNQVIEENRQRRIRIATKRERDAKAKQDFENLVNNLGRVGDTTQELVALELQLQESLKKTL